VLLFVTNAPMEERATADGAMDRLLETLRFRRTAEEDAGFRPPVRRNFPALSWHKDM